MESDILKELQKPIPDEDIRWKIQAKLQNGRAIVVPYIDARVVIDRLNAVVGTGWSDEYELFSGKVRDYDRGYYAKCTLTINGVSRVDVGEGEYPKDAISDALKRAALKYGVGRNLYSGPKIIAAVDGSRITTPLDVIMDAWKNGTDGSFIDVSQRGAQTTNEPANVGAPTTSSQHGNSGGFDCSKLAGRPVSEKQQRMIYAILTSERGFNRDLARKFIEWAEVSAMDAEGACKLIDDIRNDDAFEALKSAFLDEIGADDADALF